MPVAEAGGWFRCEELGDNVAGFTEPFLNEIFRAKIYLVRGRDRDLVVDAGMGVARLRPALGVPGRREVVCVATHVHADHVGSFHEFEHRWGPRVGAAAFASMPDEATFADEFRQLSRPVSKLPEPGWRAEDYRVCPAPLTRLLAEGDLVDLGDRRFRVLALPGHSPDSIGLLDEAAGVLFSGDAIHGGRLYDALPCSDQAAYRATMRRLLNLPVRIVHGGHGPSLPGEEMRAVARSYLERTGM